MDIPRDPHFYRKELDLRMSCSYGPGRYDVNYEDNGQDINSRAACENGTIIKEQYVISTTGTDNTDITVIGGTHRDSSVSVIQNGTSIEIDG